MMLPRHPIKVGEGKWNKGKKETKGMIAGSNSDTEIPTWKKLFAWLSHIRGLVNDWRHAVHLQPRKRWFSLCVSERERERKGKKINFVSITSWDH